MPLHNFLCVDWFYFKEKRISKTIEKCIRNIRKGKENGNSLLSPLLARRPTSSSSDLVLLGLFSSSAQQAARPPQLSSHEPSSSFSCAPSSGLAQPSAAKARNALLFSL
jgi:hypothetical protein